MKTTSIDIQFLILAAFLGFSAVPGAIAADIFVNNTGDTGPGSLRQAVDTANTTPGVDRILFEEIVDGGVITLTTGEIGFTDTTGLTEVDASNLASGIAVSGNDASRVFKIATNVSVTIKSMGIQNGKAAEGANGTTAATPTDGAPGENGGAIFNEGTLTLIECLVTNSSAGDGGNGGINEGLTMNTGANGGDGGAGGGIYSTGDLTLEGTTVAFNAAGNGGTGGHGESAGQEPPGFGGDGGNGGGIYQAGEELSLTNSVIQSNTAGNGGAGGSHGDSGIGADGGDGGNGGGIIAVGSTLNVSQSTFVLNQAGNGGLGGSDTFNQNDTGGPGGDGGDGGGLLLFSFQGLVAEISQSLFRLNQAGDGANGGSVPNMVFAATATDGGDGGSGGGLVVLNASAPGSEFRLTNSTFSANIVGDGGDGGDADANGTGGDGGDGGDGGGLLFDKILGDDYTAILNQATVLANFAGSGGLAGNPNGVAGNDGAGGGILEASEISPGGGIQIANTIVANNQATTFPNLDIANVTAFGNNITAGNPMLDGLANNGGPTLTHLPLPGSPAIDTGIDLATPITTDQRDKPRPFNNNPDIGAVEIVRQPDLRVGRNANPATQKVDDFYSAGGAGQRHNVVLRKKRAQNVFLTLQNDGDHQENLRLRSNRPKRTLNLKVFRTDGGRINITAAVVRQGFTFNTIDPDLFATIQARLKARATDKKVRRQRLPFTGFSQAIFGRKDTARLIVNFK